jgi:transposase
LKSPKKHSSALQNHVQQLLQHRLACFDTQLQVFEMRSMTTGAAYHRAYMNPTQQAFLEGRQRAFTYFGGVLRTLRYDNLKSAVKRVLRGYRREEATRFIAFRSHWRFQSEFCNPTRGNEKGGVEGEGGYFRHNHWVPLPEAGDLDELNAYSGAVLPW